MDAPISAYLAARQAGPVDGKRPFICLSFAQSLDGSIALQPGAPYSLSGSSSLVLTHQLRAQHDAILVGIGTILSDDPQLNLRFADGIDPQPVILDSQLRTPPGSKVFHGTKPPWIATKETTSSKKARTLISAGARLLSYHQNSYPRIPLGPLLSDLVREGIESVMVEGGAEVIQSFLTAGLVDWIMITIAPEILNGLPALGETGPDRQNFPIRLSKSGWSQYQEDMVVWGQPVWLAQ